MNLLSDFAKPLVAAVNGYAVGIGCIVTYCCDLIVASERAEWRLPQVALGILPAQGGTVRLARWVGRGQASEGRNGLSAEGRGGLPHRARAMAGAARRRDGEGDGGRRAHRRVAAAGGAARQGIGRVRDGRDAARGGQRRPLPLHGARADRRQEGGAPGLARAPQAGHEGPVIALSAVSAPLSRGVSPPGLDSASAASISATASATLVTTLSEAVAAIASAS